MAPVLHAALSVTFRRSVCGASHAPAPSLPGFEGQRELSAGLLHRPVLADGGIRDSTQRFPLSKEADLPSESVYAADFRTVARVQSGQDGMCSALRSNGPPCLLCSERSEAFAIVMPAAQPGTALVSIALGVERAVA
jgi:hypothetical protein